jgi:hypothetical protein
MLSFPKGKADADAAVSFTLAGRFADAVEEVLSPRRAAVPCVCSRPHALFFPH